MARTLTQLDEWPRHQTLDTFDVVSSDSERWSDGYWTCVGDPEGRCNLITALRWYPNTNVVDGYAICALGDGRQYNLRVSRRMRPAIDDLSCGPLRMEILEGLRTFTFTCGPNDHAIEFDLRWEGVAPCFDETPGVRSYVDGRIARARSNFVQLGDVTGTITVDGRRFEVDHTWCGARDHSWGVGDTGTGEHPGYAAPTATMAVKGAQLRNFGLRQWALVRFPTRAIFYRIHLGADGRFSAFNTHVDPRFGVLDHDDPGYGYTSAKVEDVQFVEGRRRVASVITSFTTAEGAVERFKATTVSAPAYMYGGGYWGGYADGLGRGVYRGELLVEGDVWDVSHPTIVRDLRGEEIPQPNGAWAETFAIFENLDDPSERDVGFLEAVVGGPYPGVTEQ